MPRRLVFLLAAACTSPPMPIGPPSAAGRMRADTVVPGPSFGWGTSAGAGGDVNGDGYDDLVFGAMQDGPSFAGRAYVYHGGPNGVSTVATTTLNALAQGGVVDYFGWSSAIAGDTNGDGYDDLLVGAAYGGAANSGEAYVYLGSAAGIGTVPTRLPGAGNGFVVAALGDLNGDGYDDVGAGNRVYLGSAAGVSTTAAATLGSTVRSAGDMNGDGYDDVFAGNAPASSGAIHLGGPAGVSLLPEVEWFGEESDDDFGGTAASADVDGDGYDDLWVGARYSFLGGNFAGRVALYLGGPGALSDAPVLTANGRAGQEVGYGLAAVGDHNGDGFGDVLCGEYSDANLLHGATIPFPVLAPPVVVGNDAHDTLSGGDLDGDGYDDLVVGDPLGLVVHYGFPDVDRDWVADADDVCPDGNDLLDTDADATPDDCDTCIRAALFVDDDGDTVCNADDLCADGDDRNDGDGDTVPDDCDVCASGDDALDGDGDGTADGCDLCEGSDDQLDQDQDGIPTGCDPTPYAAVLEPPVPGVAGVLNHLTVTGASGGTKTWLLSGTAAGLTPVAGCPGLTVPITHIRRQDEAFADGSGAATLDLDVPAALSGDRYYVVLQPIACLVSNVVVHTW